MYFHMKIQTLVMRNLRHLCTLYVIQCENYFKSLHVTKKQSEGFQTFHENSNCYIYYHFIQPFNGSSPVKGLNSSNK